MPIFQEDIHHPAAVVNAASSGSRRYSEESLPDGPEQGPKTSESQNHSHMLDRCVLIERLKRRESPSWKSQHDDVGLEIERPRSALHSGDFTHDTTTTTINQGFLGQSSRSHRQRTSVDMTWMSSMSPPRSLMPSFHIDRPSHFADPGDCLRLANSPALSSSLSSSTFTYQLPTSPLARSVTNGDEDSFSTPSFRQSGFLSDKMDISRSSSDEFLSLQTPPRSSCRSGGHLDRTFAYQAHQPRRSSASGLGGILHAGQSQKPMLPSRRPSLGSDSTTTTSLHASMVGPYEESILHGRMSTTPSKPFDFMAQIGVLGKGKCNSGLRCPAHVTLAFPAVFYSYSNTSIARSQSNDGPSPYVGQIDLENGLSASDASRPRKWKVVVRRQSPTTKDVDVDMLLHGPLPHHDSHYPAQPLLKAPPGGSYRIPEKGQIQIVIKNQNKTAVKLFLVPYDLTEMPCGTKTFIRQRSYSHGPIIDNLPNQSSASASAVAMGRPILRYLVHLHICSPSKGRFYLYKSIRVVFANRVPEGKEKLRNETTSPEPRFTPYKPILQMHPPVSSDASSLSGRCGSRLAADKAYRRRSLGVTPAQTDEAPRSPFSTAMLATLNDGHQQQPQEEKEEEENKGRYFGPRVDNFSATGSVTGNGNTRPIDVVPYRFPRRGNDCTDGVVDDDNDDGAGPVTWPSRPSTQGSSRPGSWESRQYPQYEKLSKGDFGRVRWKVGGNLRSSEAASGSKVGSEGLLSQRLRGLD